VRLTVADGRVTGDGLVAMEGRGEAIS